MLSFKSIVEKAQSVVKHPVVAPIIASALIAVGLKVTGLLPTVLNWLGTTLGRSVPIWTAIAFAVIVGCAVWIFRRPPRKEIQSKSYEFRPPSKAERAVLNLFLKVDGEMLELIEISNVTGMSKIITENALESLEDRDLIRTGGLYNEKYLLTKRGRGVLADAIQQDE